LYLKNFPSFLDFSQCRLRNEIETPNIKVIEENLGDFFKESDFLEEEVNVELLLALFPALVVLLHLLPVDLAPQHAQQVEDTVAEVDDEVELLRTVRSQLILLEYTVPEFDLIGVFVVEAEH
jgi:hypothetical protein